MVGGLRLNSVQIGQVVDCVVLETCQVVPRVFHREQNLARASLKPHFGALELRVLKFNDVDVAQFLENLGLSVMGR